MSSILPFDPANMHESQVSLVTEYGCLDSVSGELRNPVTAEPGCTLSLLGAISAYMLAGITPLNATFPSSNGLIAFQAQATADAHIQIYTVRQNGHDLRQITHVSGDATRPDWSPDGRQIVFEIDRNEAPFCSIALMNADGSDIVELTPTANVCDNDPSFTPDGARIFFDRLDGVD